MIAGLAMKRHLKMDSDSDSNSADSIKISRLGKCEVCAYTAAKYTCPRCEVKTCSLSCLQIHKKELGCSGIRDKTKFIPLKEMTEMDYLSDYTFLEDCTRYVEDRKRDKVKRYTRYNKVLPPHLFALRNSALERGTTLRFLLDNFTRRKINTTCRDKKSKVLFWRVEWIFTNAANLKFEDAKCSEEEAICKLLEKYINPEAAVELPEAGRKALEFYQSKGMGSLKVLLKAEGIKRCKERFYLLDSEKSLKENLAGKIIVEFPCIHVCYEDSLGCFDVIRSDEDVETETKQYRDSLNTLHKNRIEKIKQEQITVKTEKDIEIKLENLAIEKKREERRIKREQLEKEPGNLLFADERLWDLLSSDSEDGNETEEEIT